MEFATTAVINDGAYSHRYDIPAGDPTMTRTAEMDRRNGLLAIVMLAAGWLLLISPQRSEAAELRAAAASQRSINASLQVRLDELVAKSADLPALQDRLQAVRSRLPSEAEPARAHPIIDPGRERRGDDPHRHRPGGSAARRGRGAGAPAAGAAAPAPVAARPRSAVSSFTPSMSR